MKKILIIIPYRTFYKVLAALAAAALLAVAFMVIDFTTANEVPVSDHLWEDETAGLEKENTKLKELLKHILPENNQPIYEDEYRNRYSKAPGYTPATFKTYPIPEVLKKGKDTKFDILSDHPSYLRPVYDSSWKGFYFRGWLDLDKKNIEARHKLFIYPFGASSIFDFEGSLGLEDSPAVDYHRNINFLIYGFSIQSIKWYENQAILTGEPLRTGFHVVSVIQDDLLPEGISTKDMLFQLCTPQGYEIDFIYGSIIEYAHLKKQIEDNTVLNTSLNISDYKTLEQLLSENLGLKKELAYFIPLEDKTITQEKCRPVPPNFPFEAPDIAAVRKKAEKLPFKVIYRDTEYRRPVYDPEWLKNYRKWWCYIPRQICYNQHRIFTLPQNPEEQVILYGILGFHESSGFIDPDAYSFLVYNTNVSEAMIYRNQILLTGTPSRTGAEIITVKRSSLPINQDYLVRLITPDNQETDYTFLYPY